MRYIVQREYQLADDADWETPEMAGALLRPGDMIWDGDIEPDICAKLVYRGVLAPENQGAEPPVAIEPEAFDEAEFNPDDEADG